MLDYTSLPACSELTLSLAGLTDEPDDLTALLTSTAGSKLVSSVSVSYYRPYYVAALMLSRKLGQITTAEGVAFRAPPVQSLLHQQAALDAALGLTIPPGTSAAPASSIESLLEW